LFAQGVAALGEVVQPRIQLQQPRLSAIRFVLSVTRVIHHPVDHLLLLVGQLALRGGFC
jgi:hypothetical protein|tara:strand:- start:4855 stop:5031 length:177 start_codon:yes stop_codon:yes gene_type:complete